MLADAATVGLVFFLGFVGLSVAILATLRFWLVEGTLETGAALGVIGVLLIGSALAAKTASPLLMLLWIVAMIGGAVGLPMLLASAEKRELERMMEEDIAKYRRALDHEVQNPVAWREMADIYLKMNRYDEAIAAYKEAIRLEPHDVQQIRRRLNQALDYRAGVPFAPTVVCSECGQETPKGKTCRHCGEKLDMNFLQWLFQPQNLREVLKPTVAITVGVIALLTVFSVLPVELKALVIVACVLVGGFLIWRAVQDAD